MFLSSAIDGLMIQLPLKDVYRALDHHVPEVEPIAALKALQLTTQQLEEVVSMDDIPCRITPLGQKQLICGTVCCPRHRCKKTFFFVFILKQKRVF